MNIFEQLQRRRLLLPSFEEIADAFANLTVQEVSVIVGAALWVVLLCMPLKHIDRRDNTTAVTFIFWMIAVGTVLVLALPNTMFGIMRSGDHLLIMFAFACLASIRWGLRRRFNSVTVIADSQNTEKKA